MEDSKIKLVELAKTGNQEAFSKLIEEVKLKLYKTGISILKNDEDTCDAIQETLINAYKRIDNYATSMSWTEYWAPGIKFQYPTEFTLTEEGGWNRGARQGEVSTRISGTAVGINPDTKERIDSNLIIYIYEPLITKEDVSKYRYGSKGLEKAHFTTNSGLVWYYDSGEGKELPHVEECTHIESLSDGYNAIYKIEFHTDKRENYKVTNIMNWLLGSTKLTSY